MRFRTNTVRLLLPLASLAASLTGVPASGAGVQTTTYQSFANAPPTAEFLDSVGINTHWEYRDTPYWKDYRRVRDLLIAAGIRHVRDGWNSRIADLASHGIRSDVITDPKLTPLKQLHAEIRPYIASGAIDAIEGPNEPDLFWPRSGTTYRGEGFPKGTVAFQRDLYREFKSDPATARVPIIGFSLGTTFDPGGGRPSPFGRSELSGIVDFGNFHPYPFNGNPFGAKIAYGTLRSLYADGNFPSINLDRFPVALSVYATPFSPKPMMATETGYPTSAEGTSEALQAKYVPRLFAEYFRLGVKRTYLYSLIDDSDERDGTFGILRRDLRPKPAYRALASLMRTLTSQADGHGALQPGPKTSIVIRARGSGAFTDASFLHSLLLHDSKDHFSLLLWNEAAGEDRSVWPHRPVAVPELETEIALPASAHAVALWRYDDRFSFVRDELPASGSHIHLTVPDTVEVLSIVCGSG